MRSVHSSRVGAQSDAQSDARGDGIPPQALWIIWVFWLFFLWQPISEILQQPSAELKAFDLGAMALFIGLYLWITWQEAWRLTRTTPAPARESSLLNTWGPIAALLALGVTMVLIAAICGRLSAWGVIAAVIGLTLLAVLLSFVTGSPLSSTGQIFFIVPAVGSFVYFFGRAIRTNQELRRARQEIARLAVSEERLRFARDLHDLLGHTLSLIALKSELARRLVNAAPERAAVEIGDIETAARQALIEVREAVTDYRQPTLHAELSGARELLAAAGVALTQQGEPPALAPGVEAALSWAVREGVTNVIRHSTARTCAITFARRDGQVSAEVRDDGAARGDGAEGARDRVVGASSARGAGLTGLRERVAALGGSCEAGAVEGGGWRLVVTLPVGGDDATPDQVDTPQSPQAANHEAQTGARAEKRMTAWFG
jgi:two-component system sensor histidine kinase DesK